MKNHPFALIAACVALSAATGSAQTVIRTPVTGRAGTTPVVPQLNLNIIDMNRGLNAGGAPISFANASFAAPAAPAIVTAANPELQAVPTPALKQVPSGLAAPSVSKESGAPVSRRLSGMAEAVKPELDAIAAPSQTDDGSNSSAERVMTALGGQAKQSLPALDASLTPAGTPAKAVKKSGLAPSAKGRTAPLVAPSYAEGVSAEHQALLNETLTRRKAGWIRGIAAQGVKLEGPVAPVFKVVSSKDIAKGEKVEYVIEWSQTEMNVGSFKAIVAKKNLNPELRRMPAPAVPDERKLTLRFKKSVVAGAGGLNVEAQVTSDDIKAFLQDHRLRLIYEDRYNGIVIAAVTGADKAETVADKLSGQGIVLAASTYKYDAPKERQIHLVFKKTTVADLGIRVEVSVSDTDKAELLRSMGLKVLEIDREGGFRVAVAQGASADAAAESLSKSKLVRHAYAELADAPEDRQVVLQFKDSVIVDAGGLKVETNVGDDEVASILNSRGIKVIESLGEKAYRVAAPAGMTGKDLAAALGGEAAVKSAVAVGTLADSAIEGAARGVASYKGRPWSSTEYNMNYAMAEWSLVERGATRAQLERFRKLCDEAPVRGGGFNPWSGD